MKHFRFAVVVLCCCAFATAQRLPDTVVPSHYKLTLTPDLQNARFSGEETINVNVNAPTTTITLNSLDIAFDSAEVVSGGAAQKATVALDEPKEMATLKVVQAIPRGPAEIRIRYRGTLNDKLRGFYLAKSEGHRYAVTQFEPTDARRAFPGFDEPAYKAVFDVTVIAPKGDTAISNSKIISDEPGPGSDQHTIRFATSPKMSTYLVAVLVGEFECIEGAADNVPIRVCAPPGKQEMGRFALNASEHVLKFYDQYFGIKYPYGKLDHIAIPDFEAGAMENIGAITYRDSALLVDEKHASVGTLKGVAGVIAHEMAHQWFGDLVTMQWWNDIWLNEGFATWMSFKPIEAWKPEWHVDMDEQDSADEAMATDSLRNTRPIRQPAETSAQINELFDAIAYNKTAAVLRMVESYVGDQVFRQGINQYLQAHANANATAENFWNAIATASHKPADRIMRSFVDLPGIPQVSADAHCTQGGVTLTQRRFTLDPAQADRAGSEAWTIPVCVQAKPGMQRECTLLSEKQQTWKTAQCSAGLNLNAGARGYYRSGYGRDTVTSLARSASTALTPVERLALLDNEWALVRAGEHRIGTFLDLADGVKGDNTHAVISDLGAHLRSISDDLLNPADREPYEAWVRAALRPKMEQVGWTPAPNDDDERRSLRASVFYTLGYSGRDPEALNHAKELLQKYMQNPASVDPTLLRPVFMLSALQGAPALYDEFVARAKGAKDPETYYRYLFALTQFGDPALLKRTLEYALSSQVRNQDMPQVIAGVMVNPAGRDLAWQFVRAHWSEVQKKSSIWGAAIIVQVSGAFCDATKGREVQQFFTEHPVPAAERTLKQAVEEIDDCVRMKNEQQTNLATWLHEQRTGAKAASGK